MVGDGCQHPKTAPGGRPAHTAGALLCMQGVPVTYSAHQVVLYLVLDQGPPAGPHQVVHGCAVVELITVGVGLQEHTAQTHTQSFYPFLHIPAVFCMVVFCTKKRKQVNATIQAGCWKGLSLALMTAPWGPCCAFSMLPGSSQMQSSVPMIAGYSTKREQSSHQLGKLSQSNALSRHAAMQSCCVVLTCRTAGMRCGK